MSKFPDTKFRSLCNFEMTVTVTSAKCAGFKVCSDVDLE